MTHWLLVIHIKNTRIFLVKLFGKRMNNNRIEYLIKALSRLFKDLKLSTFNTFYKIILHAVPSDITGAYLR